MRPEEMANIHGVEEGLENRIGKAAQNSVSLDEMILNVKSKRYTYTRISRILLHCLLHVTKEQIIQANLAVPYARVLGVRKNKTELLTRIRQSSAIPILVRTEDFIDNAIFHYDCYATDVYSLLQQKTAPAGRDLTQKLIKV